MQRSKGSTKWLCILYMLFIVYFYVVAFVAMTPMEMECASATEKKNTEPAQQQQHREERKKNECGDDDNTSVMIITFRT